MIKYIIFSSIFLGIISCNSGKKSYSDNHAYQDVKVVGAMKNVMWKGELGGNFNLDTVVMKKGLYGLGPESNLTGELLVMDGRSYVSRVTSDTTMKVNETFDVTAPFFVYSYVNEWREVELPSGIKTIQNLEKFIDSKTVEYKRPFAFKLKGKATNAIIHVQNLPVGTKVTSPTEAHQGQINYPLKDALIDVVGFFSTEHKGVFTHHDSFLHMHLITQDGSQMGHLDELEIENMNLYLPIK